MRMTAEGIQSLVSKRIYERGKDYYAQGRVLDCLLKNGILFARVQGSLPDPYQVKIFFGGKRIPHGECACPCVWGELCKHAIAALLQLALGAPQTRKRSLSPQGKALLLTENASATSVGVRFILPHSLSSGNLSKGIKVALEILHGDLPAMSVDPWDLIYSWSYRDTQCPYPPSNAFSASQQYCLKLLAGFVKEDYEDEGIDALQVSLLLRESAGQESIEFFDTRGKKLHVHWDQKIGVSIAIARKDVATMSIALSTRLPGQTETLLDGVFIAGRPCWMFDLQGGHIFPFEDVFDERLLTKVFLVNQAIELTAAEYPVFVDSVLNPLKGHCTLAYQDQALEQITVIDASVIIQLYLQGNAKALTIEYKCVYQDQIHPLKDLMKAGLYLATALDFVWIKRDIQEEKKAIGFLNGVCGFNLDNEGQFVLRDTDRIIDFMFNQLSGLSAQYQVFYAQGLKEQFDAKNVLQASIHLGAEGLDWFYFDARYKAEGIAEEFTQEDIRRQLLKGKNYIQLKNGSILPIALDAYTKVQDMLDEFEGDAQHLPAFHTPFLMEEAARKGMSITFNESFRQLHEKLKSFRAIENAQAPALLRAVLRDYQHKGLDWLEFLRGFKFGGILADEMGLGKTLQVLALLQKQVDAGETAPNLVVCPTTLVWNWQAEIQKFAPDLKVLIPQGSNRREQIKDISEYHLVITSYALLRRDASFYEKTTFNYMVLDEAQNIKNRNTLNARMSKRIKSRYRLVMTGTPLENSIADLWSIFDFLMPGFLGGYERFRSRYEMPILRDQNKEILENLARKIKPFMLRRLKKEVIKELPERIEQVSFCALEPTQYKCYEQMLALARKEVTDVYAAKGFNKSRMKILTVILRLRQICCHPELAKVNLGHRLLVSAKLNLLKEMLQEILSGGHKVLIFSQFVGMLAIIGEYLNKEKIVFEYMDGSTKDRPEAVNRFNNAPDVKVFLLSLKVGGVGLNLTSADTVILFEPWWNPAVEDQAIDRAHRIGQKNTVMAYKFISKGTIEEKILELQKRKKNINDSLVVAEEGIAKKLGWEDIRFLLDI